MRWEEAMTVLHEWAGSRVVVVAYLEPGVSLAPVLADLALERPGAGVVRLTLPGLGIALRRSTFIEASWIPGRDGTGLSIVQGGARVDVFLDATAERRSDAA